MLSFVPAGMARSVAEYIAALVPGAVLLFAFFLAAEAAMIFLGTGSSILSLAFVPVICIMPILAGVVSTLFLEKLRKKPLTMQRGAVVGAAAGFAGAAISALLLGLVKLYLQRPPFGSILPSGILTLVVLVLVVIIDAVLGALGGALVVKFIKEA